MSSCDAEARIAGQPLTHRLVSVDVIASIGKPTVVNCSVDLGRRSATIPAFASEVIGNQFTIAFATPSAQGAFSGHVASIELDQISGRFAVKGPLSRLDGSPRCAAFAEKTVAEIIESILIRAK